MLWGRGEAAATESDPPAIGAPFLAAREAALQLARREPVPHTAAEIGEQILHISLTCEILKREMARLMGVFSSTHEDEAQGFAAPTEWLRHSANLSVSDALEFDVVGRHIAKLQGSCQALEEGMVGFGHLVHMARNAEFGARQGAEGFDEAPLLEKAKEESVSRFRHTVLHARHVQFPKEAAGAEVDAVESRELSFNPMEDGTAYINIRLDQAEAAFTRSVLEPRAKRLGPDDHRLRRRRLADAFVELIHEVLVERDGCEVVGRHVVINVTCTAETLMGLSGAPAADIEFGDPISGATVARLACEAKITKILLDGKLIPVGVATTKRVLSKAERRALNARDGHCRYPGCHREPSSCEGHHILWWSRGGKTELKNMILLCAYHHWRVHEGGWVLVVSDDLSRVEAIPPQLSGLARGPGSKRAA